MTEAEWLACTNPEQVFLAYGDTCSDRKLILFCVRCCYLNPIPDRTEKYVERLAAKWRVAERFADGEVTVNQVRRSWSSGRAPGGGPGPGWPEQPREWATAWLVPSRRTVRCTIPDEVLIAYVRDIFGNPFREATVDPEWLTPTVVQLATGIYEDRAFDRMPILADALQDAGCDNEDMLAHCRGSGIGSRGALSPCNYHTRGCWVIDLLTGKE